MNLNFIEANNWGILQYNSIPELMAKPLSMFHFLV